LRLLVLIIAVIYTAAAGWNAFKALHVRGMHVIGVYDLAKAWQGSDGPKKLAESTANHILASHSAINAKVTSIKITHDHLIRAFFFYIVLLLIDPVTYQIQSIGIISKAKDSTGEVSNANVQTEAPKSQKTKQSVEMKKIEKPSGDCDVKAIDKKTPK
jgi:hypothetical protein